ncbi:MAG: hypothetical protein ACLPTQ_08390 [Terriglobales bacterium]
MYDDFYENLLWQDANDRQRLDAILRGKRESRMGHEHSEDAVTWNMFRFLECHGLLSAAISNISACPPDEPLTVFWTTHDGCLWEPWRTCSDAFCEKSFARSEADLIFLWPQRMLVIVEAKFRSANCSDPKKRKDELRKSKRYIEQEQVAEYFNRDGAHEAVRDGYYELLRNWALGTHLAGTLGCEIFVLVNLLRKRHETIHGENPRAQFADRACVLSPARNFVVAYWEDLIASALTLSGHADSELLIKWSKNKSELLGQPAFDF